MFLAVLGALLLAPLAVLAFALFRALVLFFPTMLALGALHTYVPVVPPLGWAATFWLVAVLSLLIPTGSSSND